MKKHMFDEDVVRKTILNRIATIIICIALTFPLMFWDKSTINNVLVVPANNSIVFFILGVMFVLAGSLFFESVGVLIMKFFDWNPYIYGYNTAAIQSHTKGDIIISFGGRVAVGVIVCVIFLLIFAFSSSLGQKLYKVFFTV
jgi:hypothetical protein